MVGDSTAGAAPLIAVVPAAAREKARKNKIFKRHVSLAQTPPLIDTDLDGAVTFVWCNKEAENDSLWNNGALYESASEHRTCAQVEEMYNSFCEASFHTVLGAICFHPPLAVSLRSFVSNR